MGMEDYNSDGVLQMIESLARRGHTVMWNEIYKEFRPMQVDDESCWWWHDPEDCGNVDFVKAVQRTYGNVNS